MRYFLCTVLISGPLVMNFIAESQASQQPKTLDLADERRRAFDWMTTLGYPETKDLKFILVATGHWLQHGNNPAENRFQYGFLVEDQGKSFKILSLDLEGQTFEKTPPKTEAYKVVGYEILDLEKEALAWLAEMKADPDQEKKPRRRMGVFFGPSFSTRTETFLLAWVCSRRGLDTTAGKLYDYARDPKHNRYGEDQEKPPKTLQEKVADELAHVEMWRGILAFGDPKIRRAELVKRFERLTKNFPKSSHHARAVETVALLKKMIKEDEDHEANRKKGKPFDQLSTTEQVAELIFQLRDQNGHQFMQPGHCDIFDRFGGKDDTAAHKLVKMSYDAVPQLIEHLDDERFTRSVGYHRNFYFSHYVLRVNDCALAILEEIAGVSFWRSTSTFSYMSMDKKSAEAKKQAQGWYAEFKKKGEKGLLIEATERGDSSEMASRLAKRYPKDALPILIKSAKSAKVGHVRATMVGLIASMQGEESISFLLAELKDGPLAQPRLTAAEELRKLGRPDGLAAMIGWWKNTANRKLDDEDPASWSHYLAEYLANCGELEAIHALAKDLRKRPINVRMSVIDGLGGRQSYSFEQKPKKDQKVDVAKEGLLVAALDDTEERAGESGSRNGKHYTDPRVCDIAGYTLNQLYPDKYAFDLAASLRVRDRQMVVMKNVWRSENKLPLLPVPEVQKALPIPADKLRPILDRYLAASGDARRAAGDEIENLGLGALPGVLERRDKAGDKTERAVWDDLAKRLSCIVAEIEIDERSAKPDAKLAKRLEALKGKSFNAKTFIAAVGAALKDSPNDAQGVRVLVVRAGDGTGFTMKFELLANPKDVKGAPSQWDHSESVRVGKEFVRGQFGASSGVANWTDGNYPDLEKTLTRAVASDPDQTVEIRIHLAPEWRMQQ
jgi:hypothetical protein